MADLTVKELEVVREIPGNPPEKGGPAKVMKIIFDGDDRQPELFTTAKTKLPAVGDKVPDTDLEWNDQWNRWQIKKKDSGKGGKGGRSEADSKRMNRASAQKQALHREQNLIAAGQPPFTDDELREVIAWFEDDIYGKMRAGVQRGPMTSDVPGDDADLPWTRRTEEEIANDIRNVEGEAQ